MKRAIGFALAVALHAWEVDAQSRTVWSAANAWCRQYLPEWQAEEIHGNPGPLLTIPSPTAIPVRVVAYSRCASPFPCQREDHLVCLVSHTTQGVSWTCQRALPRRERP